MANNNNNSNQNSNSGQNSSSQSGSNSNQVGQIPNVLPEDRTIIEKGESSGTIKK